MPGKLHRPWASLHLQTHSRLTDVKKEIKIGIEPVVEGGSKEVRRIKSLPEACVGVMSYRMEEGILSVILGNSDFGFG